MSLISPAQRHHERLTLWLQRRLHEPESAEAKEHAPKLMEDEEGEEEGSSSESEGERRRAERGHGVGGGRKAELMMATKPHRQLCRSPCLDRPSFSQSSTLQEMRAEDSPATPTSSTLAPPSPLVGHTPADRDYQSKMEFALKLGYSGEQVEAVLSKLGPSALTNDVLAELVRLGNKGEIEAQTQTQSSSGLSPAGLALTPRGSGGKEVVSPEVSLEEETTDTYDNLRPIVIDGSNVAMRYWVLQTFRSNVIQCGAGVTRI